MCQMWKFWEKLVLYKIWYPQLSVNDVLIWANTMPLQPSSTCGKCCVSKSQNECYNLDVDTNLGYFGFQLLPLMVHILRLVESLSFYFLDTIAEFTVMSEIWWHKGFGKAWSKNKVPPQKSLVGHSHPRVCGSWPQTLDLCWSSEKQSLHRHSALAYVSPIACRAIFDVFVISMITYTHQAQNSGYSVHQDWWGGYQSTPQ